MILLYFLLSSLLTFPLSVILSQTFSTFWSLKPPLSTPRACPPHLAPYRAQLCLVSVSSPTYPLKLSPVLAFSPVWMVEMFLLHLRTVPLLRLWFPHPIDCTFFSLHRVNLIFQLVFLISYPLLYMPILSHYEKERKKKERKEERREKSLLQHYSLFLLMFPLHH